MDYADLLRSAADRHRGLGFHGRRESLSLFPPDVGRAGGWELRPGTAAFLAFLVAGLISAGLFIVLPSLGAVGMGLWVVITVGLLGAIALTFAALDGIYKAALFMYVATGQVPA